MEQVLEAWRSRGVPLNGPASAHDLGRLAEFIGTTLPADLYKLYSVANGMHDHAMDRWNVSFWSIDRVVRERDVLERSGARWVAFADFLVYSWCFRILPAGGQTRVLDDATGEEFDSLTQFFDRYNDDPASLSLVEAG